MDVIKEFNRLLGYGFQPIALRPDTKVPIIKKWNTDWNEAEVRSVFKKFPNANIGILLGDIIDVEGDTPAANRRLLQLIGDYPHPSYRSRRSTHHLFRASGFKLRIAKDNGVEFRGCGHQSVVPCSIVDGASYTWEHWCYPIPVMPAKLRMYFRSVRNKRKTLVKSGHMRLHCAECRQIKMLHKRRFALELTAFKELGLPWQCHNCRKVDLRPRCRTLKRGSKWSLCVGT